VQIAVRISIVLYCRPTISEQYLSQVSLTIHFLLSQYNGGNVPLKLSAGIAALLLAGSIGWLETSVVNAEESDSVGILRKGFQAGHYLTPPTRQPT
jgi:hypothetical protein